MVNRFERFERRLRRRQRLRCVQRPRLRDRLNPFDMFDEEGFTRRFHLGKRTVLFVFELIRGELSSPVRRGAAILPIHQLLIALSFFATGSFQIPVGDNLSVCQGTVSNMVKKVSRAIASFSSRFIQYPSHAEASEVRRKFFLIGKFPG